MRALYKLFYLSVISLLISAPLFAAESPVFIRGIRPLGMGGAFVAISDDQNAFFYNPAGITQRQGSQFVAFEVPVGVSEDTLDFYNFYQDREDDLQNFDSLPNDRKIDLLNEIDDKITDYQSRVRIGFPNTSYISGNQLVNFGMGLFGMAEIGFQFDRGMVIPSITMFGTVDIVGAVPLAHRFDVLPYIPGTMSVGTTLKWIRRMRIDERQKSILEFEEFDPQLQAGSGFGFDLGALYQPNPRWNAGLQISDVGGTTLNFESISATDPGELDKPAFSGMIPTQWNAGVAYIPSKITYWPGRSISTKDRIIFACDIRDFMSTDDRLLEDTGWKKIHMGAEFRFGPLSLRGGFNSGYPTFGGGLRVPYLGLRADYAYWADETGRFAGQLPEWNHQLTLALSWGDGKGRAYGSSDKASENVEPVAQPVVADPSVAPAPVPAEALSAPATAQTLAPPMISTTTVTAPAVTEAPVSTTPAATPAAVPAGAPAAEKQPAKADVTQPVAPGAQKK